MSQPNGRNGLVSRISGQIITALPPAFLMLVLLNIATLGVVLYVVQHNTEARNAMVQRIIEACLRRDAP